MNNAQVRHSSSLPISTDPAGLNALDSQIRTDSRNLRCGRSRPDHGATGRHPVRMSMSLSHRIVEGALVWECLVGRRDLVGRPQLLGDLRGSHSSGAPVDRLVGQAIDLGQVDAYQSRSDRIAGEPAGVHEVANRVHRSAQVLSDIGEAGVSARIDRHASLPSQWGRVAQLPAPSLTRTGMIRIRAPLTSRPGGALVGFMSASAPRSCS